MSDHTQITGFLVQVKLGLESNKSNLGLVWCAKYLVQAQFRVSSSRNHAQKEIKLSIYWM